MCNIIKIVFCDVTGIPPLELHETDPCSTPKIWRETIFLDCKTLKDPLKVAKIDGSSNQQVLWWLFIDLELYNKREMVPRPPFLPPSTENLSHLDDAT